MSRAQGAFTRVVRQYPLVVAAAAGLASGLAARPLLGHATSDWILLATLLACGLPLVGRTLWGMAKGRFAADLVAMLAIVAAIALHQYFAGAVIVLMQSGGEALERHAMGRASEALDALLARAPTVAHRLHGSSIEHVRVEDVRVGDLLLIRPGDPVPVDGEVTEGTSAVDQSAITGEPLPLQASVGTALLSGSVNLDGALTLRASRRSEHSQYQAIVELVRTARRLKPPIQRLADRWAVWFTPLTLAVCAAAYLATGDPQTVLAVLVVATPCPLILAVPVAVTAAISRAAEVGIIVKTGIAIEEMGRAKVVVFDKTGTLTIGQPTVSAARSLDGMAGDNILRLAAAVEQFSSHSLGHAIAHAGQDRFGSLPRPQEFEETPGLGVAGLVEGRRVEVGSGPFFASRGVVVPPADPGRTAAYVTVDGSVAGVVELADRLRHQVPALMQRLAVLGVHDTVMLTGDRRISAEAIAAQAGIRTVRADLLPAQKVEAIEDLKRRYGTVVMVGDGINDAPALAAATIGVAVSAHGTAAPAEAADMVLMVDDISRVADAMSISQRMRRIALQSIGVGLGVSLALMIVASFGLISPAAGAVIQEALDAGVILNALRAR
ncbi:MAG: cadmium-translocating P-type ATPase [Gemmatimonadetes bacterium]|nr:cadmium-translocating P-type ATPase [Gemmatimonadota bacterium]